MPTRGEDYQVWWPRGCADTLDGDNSAPGAMSSLANLIPDPSTPGVYVCRPANTLDIDFTAWDAAPGPTGVVTVAYQIDNVVYGMIGITGVAYSGKDYPFAYNLATATFLPVTGITVANCPVSQPTSGAWTPPEMSLTGVDLFVVHVGFPGGVSYFFGYFNILSPTAPVWNAGNTGTNGLTIVPQAVQTFNNRTYFMCGSTAFYTDTLAVNMSASNQSLTIGDLENVTAFAPLPVSTSTQAILQGLLAYKSSKIYLITGDASNSPSNLGSNLLSPSVGTQAPRSVVSTPNGVMFMANDGIRTIDFLGAVGEPNADLVIPFIYALTPSRVCAAFNSDTYRICVQNGLPINTPYQDWWFNLSRECWTGPHSFRYDCAVPVNNNFLLCNNAIISSIFLSYVVQGQGGLGVTFTENGVALSWAYITPPMADLGNIYANALLRSTIEIATPGEGQAYAFIAQNESNTVLATAAISEASNETIWGSFNWGASNWGASQSGLAPVTIPYNQAVVFNRLSTNISGPSALGFKIGTLHNAYKRLNYLLN